MSTSLERMTELASPEQFGSNEFFYEVVKRCDGQRWPWAKDFGLSANWAVDQRPINKTFWRFVTGKAIPLKPDSIYRYFTSPEINAVSLRYEIDTKDLFVALVADKESDGGYYAGVVFTGDLASTNERLVQEAREAIGREEFLRLGMIKRALLMKNANQRQYWV